MYEKVIILQRSFVVRFSLAIEHIVFDLGVDVRRWPWQVLGFGFVPAGVLLIQVCLHVHLSLRALHFYRHRGPKCFIFGDFTITFHSLQIVSDFHRFHSFIFGRSAFLGRSGFLGRSVFIGPFDCWCGRASRRTLAPCRPTVAMVLAVRRARTSTTRSSSSRSTRGRSGRAP